MNLNKQADRGSGLTASSVSYLALEYAVKSFKITLATLALTVISASVCAVPLQLASEDGFTASKTQSVKKQRSNSITLTVIESRAPQSTMKGQASSQPRVILIAPALVSHTSE